MVMRLAIRLLINAASIYLAAYLLDGMSVNGFKGALTTALAFGLMNVFVGPILHLLALPLTLLTLGLFSLVVNGATLLLTARLINSLQVDGLMTAILGSLLIAVCNWFLSLFLDRD